MRDPAAKDGVALVTGCRPRSVRSFLVGDAALGNDKFQIKVAAFLRLCPPLGSPHQKDLIGVHPGSSQEGTWSLLLAGFLQSAR